MSNVTLDIAEILVGLLGDIGLEGCMACPWTALVNDTERAGLRVSSTEGVTGMNPRGVGLDWDVYRDGNTIRVVGQNRAAGLDTTIDHSSTYVEQREQLQAMLAPLNLLHDEIYGCWSRLEGDESTVLEYVGAP